MSKYFCDRCRERGVSDVPAVWHLVGSGDFYCNTCKIRSPNRSDYFERIAVPARQHIEPVVSRPKQGLRLVHFVATKYDD